MTDSENTLKIGLALGGGAVKGLAHLGLLKILDKHKITPAHISGTSMGAIIGALYASGMTAEDIEARVREHIIEPGEKLKSIYKKRSNLINWARLFSLEKSKGGFVTADGFFIHMFDELSKLNFDQLKIPFSTCATDFETGEEVVLDNGELLPAVRASIAVPGVFAPVERECDGQLQKLVDGGLVNNVPTSHLSQCNFIIASDVIGLPKIREPKTLEVINGAINIMLVNATKRALLAFPADIENRVDTNGIEAFDFHRIDEVLKLGDIAAKTVESKLLVVLENMSKN